MTEGWTKRLPTAEISHVGKTQKCGGGAARMRLVLDMTGACARRTPQALWVCAPSVGVHVYHGNTSPTWSLRREKRTPGETPFWPDFEQWYRENTL